MKTAKRKDTSVMMLCGGAFLIAAAILQLLAWQYDWIFSIVGGVLICLAAFGNGKRGNFHASHHIVRLAVTVVLVVGFIML